MKDHNLLIPADGRPMPYNGGDLDLPYAVEAFKAALLHVGDAVPGRQQLLQQTALALLTRRHQLLISRAGTGKSLYGDSVFRQFEGTCYKALFTQGTRVETVVGGLDLELFHRGKLWHNTTHSLVTADFAYLDEFMNANDLVLEALLGILNERHFAQGEQQEDARLHTALAMTNHLKLTAISEPILDRFMFKASIDPQGDALNDIMIDLAYAQHHGKAVVPEHPIPLATLQMLSEIVTGNHAETAIEAPHSILFLKNELIERYVRTRAAATASQASALGAGLPRTESYVSPRTKAACRDVLNASAMLHHRSKVAREDLAALRYTLTTIAGNDRSAPDPTEESFREALHSTTSGYTDGDLQTVDELTTIAQTFNLYLHGAAFETQASHRGILRIFLSLIGKSSWRDVSYETFVDALQGKQIANPRVNALREEILGSIMEHSASAS